MEIFLTAEQNQLRIICESLEAKARGFELQSELQSPLDGQKMAMSAETQRQWAVAYRRAATIIRDQIASE